MSYAKRHEIDVYDLALLKRAVLAGENYLWADCDADGQTGVVDIIEHRPCPGDTHLFAWL